MYLHKRRAVRSAGGYYMVVRRNGTAHLGPPQSIARQPELHAELPMAGPAVYGRSAAAEMIVLRVAASLSGIPMSVHVGVNFNNHLQWRHIAQGMHTAHRAGAGNGPAYMCTNYKQETDGRSRI